jgi:N4-gp56 family major capsid protein
MATTLVRDGLRVQQWDEKFFVEFIRDNKFAPFIGTGEGSIIHMKEQLSKVAGDSLTWQMIGRLKNDATRGATTLSNNEEFLNNRSMRVYVELIRNAVAIDTKTEQIKTDIDLRNAGRSALKKWQMETFRDDIIEAMLSIDGVNFSDATAAQRNTWLTNNSDRVLFGKLKSNASSNIHATALATLDATDDLLTPAAISLMKRIAKTADPYIQPVTVMQDEEWFVLFCNSLSFRDLANNSTMTQANRDALQRGEKNPLFTGGDLIWDGVIIKEVEQMPVYADLGASGTTDVGPCIMCGTQALAYASAQRTRSVEDTPRDYGRILPIGIEDVRGVEKLRFGTGASDTTTPKDWGMVTGWFVAQPDS